MVPGKQTTEFALSIIAMIVLAVTALYATPGSELETTCVKGIGWVTAGYATARGLAKVGRKS